jgi:hypothetical protein
MQHQNPPFPGQDLLRDVGANDRCNAVFTGPPHPGGMGDDLAGGLRTAILEGQSMTR